MHFFSTNFFWEKMLWKLVSLVSKRREKIWHTLNDWSLMMMKLQWGNTLRYFSFWESVWFQKKKKKIIKTIEEENYAITIWSQPLRYTCSWSTQIKMILSILHCQSTELQFTYHGIHAKPWNIDCFLIAFFFSLFWNALTNAFFGGFSIQKPKECTWLKSRCCFLSHFWCNLAENCCFLLFSPATTSTIVEPFPQ